MTVKEIILCPICGDMIHEQYAAPITSRAVLPSRVDPSAAAQTLTDMMLAANAMHEELIQAAEDACAEHMRSRHARRMRLWERYHWNWLLTRRWPWQRASKHEQFGFPA